MNVAGVVLVLLALVVVAVMAYRAGYCGGRTNFSSTDRQRPSGTRRA